MLKHFKPKAGRFGTQLVHTSVNPTTVANTTTVTRIPTVSRLKFIERATVTLTTVGSDADGTILLTLKATAVDGSTVRSVSAALSLESDGVATALVPVNLALDSITDAARTLKEGETLQVSIINNSAAIDTGPVGSVAVEFAILE